MASANRTPQPAAAPGGVSVPTTAEQIQAKFELAISILLNLYAPLSLAVANEWGGPDSADKRDWFAGALSDLFIERPHTTTQEDVEDQILQIMGDEFEVALEDESEVALARAIMRVRRECERGEFASVDELWRRWVEGKGGVPVRGFQAVGQTNDENEGDSVDEESGAEDESEDEDGEMGGTEDVVKDSGRRRAKPSPEVDDEGFTKVIGRRKR